jgi:hypothetical protein
MRRGPHGCAVMCPAALDAARGARARIGGVTGDPGRQLLTIGEFADQAPPARSPPGFPTGLSGDPRPGRAAAIRSQRAPPGRALGPRSRDGFPGVEPAGIAAGSSTAVTIFPHAPAARGQRGGETHYAAPLSWAPGPRREPECRAIRYDPPTSDIGRVSGVAGIDAPATPQNPTGAPGPAGWRVMEAPGPASSTPGRRPLSGERASGYPPRRELTTAHRRLQRRTAASRSACLRRARVAAGPGVPPRRPPG